MANERIKECIQRSIDDLTAVKDAIIATGIEVSDDTPSSLYADKVTEVYEKGKSEGGNTDAAYEQGKIDGLKEWENLITNNNTRTDYTAVFNRTDFSDYVFSTPVKVQKAHNMFRMYKGKFLPKNIDLSECTQANAMCYSAKNLEVFPDMGLPAVSQLDQIFTYCNALREVEILRSNENTLYRYNPFAGCGMLEKFIMEGVIGQDGFDVHWSTLLNKESHISIMTAASTTAEITITFSLTAVNNAFETSEGLADGSTSEEWLALVATRPNVTISLG